MKTWEVKHAGRDDADFVEQLKRTRSARRAKNGELEALCSLDFHFKEVRNRFKVGLYMIQEKKPGSSSGPIPVLAKSISGGS